MAKQPSKKTLAKLARRKAREEKESMRAFRIREAHAAGNAFDRMMADGGHYATLEKPKRRRKKKKSAKLIAARERIKAEQIAALMRKDESLTPETAEALWKRNQARRKWERGAEQRAIGLAHKAAALANPGRTAEYEIYLKSPQWFAKRDQALKHHGAVCDKCGKKSDLQVHHKTYARLGKEKMEDLQILCRPCHNEVHESDPKWVRRQERRKAQSSDGKQTAES